MIANDIDRSKKFRKISDNLISILCNNLEPELIRTIWKHIIALIDLNIEDESKSLELIIMLEREIGRLELIVKCFIPDFKSKSQLHIHPGEGPITRLTPKEIRELLNIKDDKFIQSNKNIVHS